MHMVEGPQQIRTINGKFHGHPLSVKKRCDVYNY